MDYCKIFIVDKLQRFVEEKSKGKKYKLTKNSNTKYLDNDMQYHARYAWMNTIAPT